MFFVLFLIIIFYLLSFL